MLAASDLPVLALADTALDCCRCMDAPEPGASTVNGWHNAEFPTMLSPARN